jgi:menaquinol-cytochrome c reductase iron-sulfur subunit
MHEGLKRKDAELSRRGFLQVFIASLAAIGSLILGIPLISYLVGPSLRGKQPHFALAGSVTNLPEENPVDLTFPDKTEDAYIQETTLRSVWAVKQSASDVTVFSPICPHLGCRYNWEPQSDHFVCPCHGSVFAKDGKVLAGPAPRPLDTLPTKIENNDLYVEWERFKVGIPQKEVA